MTEDLLWIVVLALSVTHVAASLWQTVVLLRARNALMPATDVLPGSCVYRAQIPEGGLPDQLYCRNFRCHGVLDSVSVCKSCRHRQLPMPGGRFFDHVQLAEWPLIVLKQVVSLSVGVVAMLYSIVRLWTLLKGDAS